MLECIFGLVFGERPFLGYSGFILFKCIFFFLTVQFALSLIMEFLVCIFVSFIIKNMKVVSIASHRFNFLKRFFSQT